MTIAFIGFGEAGGILAADLAREHAVTIWDCKLNGPEREAMLSKARDSRVQVGNSLAQALEGATLVFSTVTAGEALKVAQQAAALLQPGQYAAEQTVTLVGPKGRLNNVRLLGPLRQTSQVEISRTDARILGIAAPLRMSGNLQGTPGIRLISPFAELELSGGTIVAQRHIHMSPLDALILRVSHGDSVAVAIEGSDRRLIFDNVAVRVAPDMRLEMHIDTDEANAAGADAAQAWATLVTKP